MPRYHLIALLLLPLLLPGCNRDVTPWHGRDIQGVMPDLAFTLTNDSGHPVTAADYTGKLVLLYFGYTHCEDVCPTTLNTLSTAVRNLGREADRVKILFVSVDPRRDTPEVMRHHAMHFSQQVVGLSGSDTQLYDLARRYRVAYNYGEPDTGGNYEVYHSSAIFVFDAHGRVRLLLVQNQLDTAAVTGDLRRLLDSSS